MSESVLYEVNGQVATVTLNRPSVYNAMNVDLCQGIAKAMRRAECDAAVRVVVLRGAGKAWCAGGDLREVLAMLEREDVGELHDFVHHALGALDSIRAISKPVIAAVHGDAVGGGNELSSACDFTIASDVARFGQAGPRIGSVPIILHQTLSAQIGERRAREVTFRCKLYSATDAQAMGWINTVVPPDQLDATVAEWVADLINKSPTSLAIAKKMHNFSYEQGKVGLSYLSELLVTYWRLEEPREGMRAFLEKRAPRWAQSAASAAQANH
ncbi:MAG: enoyl-CoA hydratase/isomerase family protein [Pseudomonadota bacterium]